MFHRFAARAHRGSVATATLIMCSLPDTWQTAGHFRKATYPPIIRYAAGTNVIILLSVYVLKYLGWWIISLAGVCFTVSDGQVFILHVISRLEHEI
jgi:hypothetical protein